MIAFSKATSPPVIGAKASHHMLDIVGQCSLLQIEHEIIHDLYFAGEHIQFIAALDHELIQRLTQCAGSTAFDFLFLEIGQRFLTQLFLRLGKALLLLFEERVVCSEVLQH